MTVDLAREIGARLGLPVELSASTRPGSPSRRWPPAAPTWASWPWIRREAEVAFTAPYVLIEGVYAVPGLALRTVEDVDPEGVRIGVKLGSAYDLFLSRTLQHAERRTRGRGRDVFRAEGLEAGAGIRQPMARSSRRIPTPG